MNAPRLLIESSFSLELRMPQRRAIELPSLPDYLVIYLLNSRHEHATGTLLLVNPDSSYQLESKRGRSQLLLVRLAPQLLIETATRLRLYRQAAQLLFRQPLQPLTDRRLQTTLAAITSELTSGAAGWREVIAASINQLAVYLLRNHVNVRRSDEIELSRVGIVDRRLRRAIEFMHDNCGRELSLHEIADAAYLSEFHFARLFKKITGATPHTYLAALRLEKARRLLAETDLPVGEVGARVGYTSQSHFSKVFREATELTPRAFREAAQKLD
jgi:AraC family transcriptional regulator